MDTVRWDHTSLSGYPHDTTPNLAALAALPGSVTFREAYTNAAWSLPAYASLFTGQGPLTHGVGFTRPALDPAQSTLADMFRAYGYATRAFVSGPHLAPATGLERGFESVDHLEPLLSLSGPVTDALDWLSAPSDAPRFAFVHGYDAHDPFATPGLIAERFNDGETGHAAPCSVAGWRCLRSVPPPPPSPDGEPRTKPVVRPGEPMPDAARGHLVAHYDSGLLHADHQLGRLVYGLQEAGRLDDVVLVVLSDHGERLGEDGRVGHEPGADDRVFHVPLVVRVPGDAPPPALRFPDPVARLLTTLDADGSGAIEAGEIRDPDLRAGGLRPERGRRHRPRRARRGPVDPLPRSASCRQGPWHAHRRSGGRGWTPPEGEGRAPPPRDQGR